MAEPLDDPYGVLLGGPYSLRIISICTCMCMVYRCMSLAVSRNWGPLASGLDLGFKASHIKGLGCKASCSKNSYNKDL